MSAFVHLRVHTEFSLTDGVVRVEPPKRKGGGVGGTLTSRAAELGYPAVAITDRNNLFAMVKFYKAAENAGIKPVVGVDLWLEERLLQEGIEDGQGVCEKIQLGAGTGEGEACQAGEGRGQRSGVQELCGRGVPVLIDQADEPVGQGAYRG